MDGMTPKFIHLTCTGCLTSKKRFPDKNASFTLCSCSCIICPNCAKMCKENNSRCPSCDCKKVQLMPIGPEMPEEYLELLTSIPDELQEIKIQVQLEDQIFSTLMVSYGKILAAHSKQMEKEKKLEAIEEKEIKELNEEINKKSGQISEIQEALKVLESGKESGKSLSRSSAGGKSSSMSNSDVDCSDQSCSQCREEDGNDTTVGDGTLTFARGGSIADIQGDDGEGLEPRLPTDRTNTQNEKSIEGLESLANMSLDETMIETMKSTVARKLEDRIPTLLPKTNFGRSDAEKENSLPPPHSKVNKLEAWKRDLPTVTGIELLPSTTPLQISRRHGAGGVGKDVLGRQVGRTDEGAQNRTGVHSSRTTEESIVIKKPLQGVLPPPTEPNLKIHDRAKLHKEMYAQNPEQIRKNFESQNRKCQETKGERLVVPTGIEKDQHLPGSLHSNIHTNIASKQQVVTLQDSTGHENQLRAMQKTGIFHSQQQNAYHPNESQKQQALASHHYGMYQKQQQLGAAVQNADKVAIQQPNMVDGQRARAMLQPNMLHNQHAAALQQQNFTHHQRAMATQQPNMLHKQHAVEKQHAGIPYQLQSTAGPANLNQRQREAMAAQHATMAYKQLAGSTLASMTHKQQLVNNMNDKLRLYPGNAGEGNHVGYTGQTSLDSRYVGSHVTRPGGGLINPENISLKRPHVYPGNKQPAPKVIRFENGKNIKLNSVYNR